MPTLTFDPTASAPANYFQAEVHQISTDAAIFPLNSPFYRLHLDVEGTLAVAPHNVVPLIYGVDYSFSPMFVTQSEAVGKEVYTYLLLMNKSKWSEISISYHATGGVPDARLLTEIIAAGNFDRTNPANWLNFVGEQQSLLPPTEFKINNIGVMSLFSGKLDALTNSISSTSEIAYFIQTSFATLNTALGEMQGQIDLLQNTGGNGQTLIKATAQDVTTGTNDNKYITPLALTESGVISAAITAYIATPAFATELNSIFDVTAAVNTYVSTQAFITSLSATFDVVGAVNTAVTNANIPSLVADAITVADIPALVNSSITNNLQTLSAITDVSPTYPITVDLNTLITKGRYYLPSAANQVSRNFPIANLTASSLSVDEFAITNNDILIIQRLQYLDAYGGKHYRSIIKHADNSLSFGEWNLDIPLYLGTTANISDSTNADTVVVPGEYGCYGMAYTNCVTNDGNNWPPFCSVDNLLVVRTFFTGDIFQTITTSSGLLWNRIIGGKWKCSAFPGLSYLGALTDRDLNTITIPGIYAYNYNIPAIGNFVPSGKNYPPAVTGISFGQGDIVVCYENNILVQKYYLIMQGVTNDSFVHSYIRRYDSVTSTWGSWIELGLG